MEEIWNVNLTIIINETSELAKQMKTLILSREKEKKINGRRQNREGNKVINKRTKEEKKTNTERITIAEN